MSESTDLPAGLGRLREYAAARRQQSSAEQCEFCGVDIESVHGHLVNVPSRTLLCVCRPCFLLFPPGGGARFRAVPDRYQRLDADHDDAPWDALEIPIGLAFFFRNSATGRVTAFYPSPAGATESELALEAWADLVRAVPPLDGLAPDVEALLVRRRSASPGREVMADGLTALIVPIDVCYELVGRIRRGWRGFQGGDEVWQEIDALFGRLIERAGVPA